MLTMSCDAMKEVAEDDEDGRVRCAALFSAPPTPRRPALSVALPSSPPPQSLARCRRYYEKLDDVLASTFDEPSDAPSEVT